MTGKTRRNQAMEVAMTGCQDFHQFAFLARVASGLHHRSGDWESSGPPGQLGKVAPPSEFQAEYFLKASTAFAKRYSAYPVVDHTPRRFADFGSPADEPARTLLLDFAPAISRVPETITRALFQGPNQDSTSEADSHIVAPVPWQ